MRATVEVDETLLRNARTAIGARDDAEAVEFALKAVVRNRRLDSLLNRLGKTDLDLTRDDLERLRRDD
jgi:Arc/MetJ family transcription regulator